MAPSYIRRMTAKPGNCRIVEQTADCLRLTGTRPTCTPSERGAPSCTPATGVSTGNNKQLALRIGCSPSAATTGSYGQLVTRAPSYTLRIEAKRGNWNPVVYATPCDASPATVRGCGQLGPAVSSCIRRTEASIGSRKPVEQG